MSMRISRDTMVVLAVIGVVVIPLLVVILIRGEQRLDGLAIPSSEEQGALDVTLGQVGPAERRAERARRRGIGEEELRRRELEDEERREKKKEEEEDEESLSTQFGPRDPGQISPGDRLVPEGPSPTARVTAVLNTNLLGATGQVELTLNSDMDPPILVANALADGLSQVTRYTLCVDEQVIETNESDPRGRLFLEGAVIFSEGTLSDRVVSIREGSSCGGPVLLKAVISD